MHTNKRDIEVEDTDDTVTKEQSYISGKQPSHGMPQQDDICPLVLVWCEPTLGQCCT